jgi:acyl carrier protein
MVEQRVRDVFASVFGVAPGELPQRLDPDTLSGWDSMRHVHLMIELEKAFGIEIDPILMTELATGAAIVSFVESRVAAPTDRRAA